MRNEGFGEVPSPFFASRRWKAVMFQSWRLQLREAEEAFRAGRLDEAERLLQESLKRNADDSVARFNFGLLLSEQGRTREACEILRLLSERSPNGSPGRRAARLLARLATDPGHVQMK